LESEFTKTNLAPFSWTHLSAQSLWSALIPLAPQPLSLIQPVQVEDLGLLAAVMPRANTSTLATPIMEKGLFIFAPFEIEMGVKLGLISLLGEPDAPQLSLIRPLFSLQRDYARREFLDFQE
jgi:hypothetical protein